MSLLEEARAAGLTVKVEGEKLVVRGPRDAEHIALQLLESKPRVIAILRASEGGEEGYGTEGLNWVFDLDAGHLPAAPFPLNSKMTVVDVDRFLSSLRTDLELGPRGARARTGALQEQCEELQELLGRTRRTDGEIHE